MKGKEVSQTECAQFFGVHRNTVAAWLKKDCPYIQKANKRVGKDWILDTAKVAQWREEKAVLNALGDLPDDDDELKTRKLKAETSILEIEAAKKRGEVGTIEEFEKQWRDIMIAISTRMLLIPSRVSLHLTGVNSETEIASIIDEEIRQGLSESADIDLDDES